MKYEVAWLKTPSAFDTYCAPLSLLCGSRHQCCLVMAQVPFIWDGGTVKVPMAFSHCFHGMDALFRAGLFYNSMDAAVW